MDKNCILIDKPTGWTSFDVCAKLRGMIRAEYSRRGIKPTKRQLRVGHAGTLDPFATGLLLIMTGDGTKGIDTLVKQDKHYEATLCLGATSTTGDPEGDIEQVSDREPSQRELLEVMNSFIGRIEQVPPAYSAVKVDGKRAYKRARAGEVVDMPSRVVTIHSMKLVEYVYPYAKISVRVSSGTYIRSLASDIGNKLDTGAYCYGLRRTRIADYDVANAVQPDQVEAARLLD